MPLQEIKHLFTYRYRRKAILDSTPPRVSYVKKEYKLLPVILSAETVQRWARCFHKEDAP